MEIKIHHVQEAQRIIKNYHNTLTAINQITGQLETTKNELLNMQNDVDKLTTSSETDLLKHQQTYDIILKYEGTINEMHKLLQPHIETMDQITKDSKMLYKILLEKYPMYNEKSLQEQLFKQLDELNKKAEN